jgi:hypothetical protein
MSDLTPHTRDDLMELPCDTEPKHACGCTPYLCVVCNPRRKFWHAVRNISARRDLEPWVWDELRLRRQSATIINIAHARSARAGRR